MRSEGMGTGISKQHIYEKAIYAVQMYRESGLEEYIIESAVIAGVYYGIGGKKKINIKSTYYILVLVVSAIARAKEKFGHNNERNIELLNSNLMEQTGGTIGIRNVPSQGRNSITIGIVRNDTNTGITVAIPQNRITDELLCRIAEIVMSVYNETGIETINSQNVFKSKLLTMLKIMG